MKNKNLSRHTLEKDPAHKSRHKVLHKLVDIGLPLAISAVMIVWLFKKVNLPTIIRIMRDDCDYRWLLLMCGVEIISRCVRGIRWGIQLRAAGVRRMPPIAEVSSIFGAFTLHLLLTGVGEAWRCVYVSRRQKASLSTVVGTDLGDRLSDAFMISLIIMLTFVIARPVIDRFMDNYSFGRHLVDIISSPWLWCALAILIVASILLLVSKTHNRVVLKIRKEVLNLWNGFKVLFTMRHQVRFWLYTVIIWIAYFLMTYLCFFAFPFTRDLIRPDTAYGLLPGLVVFVFGAISIAVPASGGLGPWNIAVMFALSLYGVHSSDAAAYSMVVWAFQTITQVLMGLFAAIYIAYDNHHTHQLHNSGVNS